MDFAHTRRGALTGGASAALLALGSRARGAARGGIRVRAPGDIQILDPAFQAGGLEETVNRAVLVTLTRLKADGTNGWEPYAAQSIRRISERAIWFQLRPGLTWSNGYGPVTAHDVKFSFERIAAPRSGSPWAYVWSELDRVEVLDERSGVIHLKSRYEPIWRSALPGWAGHIVCQKAVLKAGGRYSVSPPATCGPFSLSRWRPKQSLTLTANPAWTGPAPLSRRLEMLIVDDTGVAELAFEAGELDITDVNALSRPRFLRRPIPDSRLVQAPGVNFTWLGMNMDHPELRDLRVRQAIQYAVDVDAVLYGAYGGAVPRATGLIPPHILGARPRNLIGKRDVAKSRSLLQAAGAPRLTLTLSVINTAFWMTMAQIIQDNLREAGVRVDILGYDQAIFWDLGLKANPQARDIQLKLMTIPGGADPSEYTVWFTSDQLGQFNWERLSDPVIDRLNERGKVLPDGPERAATYREIQDRMEQSGAFVFIANDARSYLLRGAAQMRFRGDDFIAADLIRL